MSMWPVGEETRASRGLMWAGLALLAVAPPAAFLLDQPFWLDVFTRLVILSIAAVSLNLILGYGGLISFGHAAFLGIGAYAVGAPILHAYEGGFDAIATTSVWMHLALAIGVSALYALVTGAIALRTKGVHFIMITMAFGQMIYFTIVSMESYGGDDGLVIYEKSAVQGLNLGDPLTLYGVVFVSLLAALYISSRIVNSRFGMVIRAARGNEERVRALGFNAYLYRLAAYVISGAMCGYAGALLGNFTGFISPEMMDWAHSGELMFMVILGGVGMLFGPVIGAAVFMILQETLSGLTIYWHLPFGVLLILSVLYMKGGLAGFAGRLGGRGDG